MCVLLPTEKSSGQIFRLPPPDTTAGNYFGASVGIDGSIAVVGASGDGGCGENSGAAFVYEIGSDQEWSETARLEGSLGTEYGIFGTSAALDGDRAVVSASTYLAHQPGSLYVYDRTPETGVWRETAVLSGIEDFFISVDLDGGRILVGESKGGRRNTGRARVFDLDRDGRWISVASLEPSTKFSQGGFGSLVSLSGDHALVVGFDEQLRFEFNIDRVVYLFERGPSGRWYQKHIIDVGEVAFGSAVDLNRGKAIIGQASDQLPGQAFVVLIR